MSTSRCVYVESASGCTCDFVRQLEIAREKEKLYQFCLGLDASLYGNIQTTIVNTDPLPSVDHAYSMVATEEQMWSMTVIV